MAPSEFNPEASLPLTPLSLNILLALADDDRHGYGILKEVERRTGGKRVPATGTLYLAIQRLEEDGMIAESDNRPEAEADDERRRYYRLTRQGRLVAAAEANRLVDLIGLAYEKRLVSGHDLSGLRSRRPSRRKE